MWILISMPCDLRS